MRDPFARLPTGLRLWAGATLCVLPLGLAWSTSAGFLNLGITIYGDCAYSTEEFCTPDYYIPGGYTPGQVVLASQSTARLFLVVAAGILVFAATRVRTPRTRRLVRAASAAMGIAAALALASRATLAVLCMVAALALVAPLVRRRPQLFGPGAAGR